MSSLDKDSKIFASISGGRWSIVTTGNGGTGRERMLSLEKPRKSWSIDTTCDGEIGVAIMLDLRMGKMVQLF